MRIMNAAPPPAAPDSRDWTFVLEDGCPECAYELHDPALTGERLRALVPRWQAVLDRGDVAARPNERVWSALEYACHSRDLIEILRQRVSAMLAEDDPLFADYDGEGEAVRQQFWAADPSQVARQIAENTEATGEVLGRVRGDEWERTGRRSDGRVFTVRDVCRYLLHDVEHHLRDVAG